MPPTEAAPRRRPTLAGILLRGGVAGVALAVGLHVAYVLVGPNFHTVVPGRVYRCAQPSGRMLNALVRRFGIRTVINLRGCCDPSPWYLEECRAALRLGLSQEDLGFSAGRLPSIHALRQLVEVFEGSEYPVVLHCHKGADRTGMASAVALLLTTHATLAEARTQLDPAYGHLPLGRTTNIDRFFDLYEEWLQAQDLEHTPEVFRRWALREYCPGECRGTFEVIAPRGRPVVAPRGRPFPVVVRCTNTSVKPWHFQPGTNAGVHAQWTLLDVQANGVGFGRSGLFEAVVPPGGSIDLTLSLPALHRPGRYGLRVDLADEQHAAFLQAGNEPLVWEVQVP